jgi:hypothetical protein
MIITYFEHTWSSPMESKPSMELETRPSVNGFLPNMIITYFEHTCSSTMQSSHPWS